RGPREDVINWSLISRGGDLYCWSRYRDDRSTLQWFFTLAPREPAEFVARCREQEASPNWCDRDRCTRETPRGRVTLAERTLTTIEDGHVEECSLATETEVAAVLRDLFGIDLEAT